jgi:hypothetical protein
MTGSMRSAPGDSTRPDDDAPVWSLFTSRAAVEELMIDQVRSAVAEDHGIQIEAGP